MKYKTQTERRDDRAEEYTGAAILENGWRDYNKAFSQQHFKAGWDARDWDLKEQLGLAADADVEEVLFPFSQGGWE